MAVFGGRGNRCELLQRKDNNSNIAHRLLIAKPKAKPERERELFKAKPPRNVDYLRQLTLFQLNIGCSPISLSLAV